MATTSTPNHTYVNPGDRKTVQDAFRMIVTEEPLAQMDESVFVQNFLPYFSGELEDKDGNANFVLAWVAIAGHAGSEVEIIDEEGTVLYRVPPVFDTNVLSSKSVTTGGIDAIMSEFYRDSEILPAMANNKVHSALRTYFQKMIQKSPFAVQHRHRWIAIVKRYRTTQQIVDAFNKTTGGELKPVTVKPASSKTDDGPNFDD